jgi:hypothetical protein
MGANVSKYGTASNAWTPANSDSLGREITVSPLTPVMKRLIIDAAAKTQFVAPARIREGTPGELPQIAAAGANAMQDVETSIWYHTSGDTPETVSAQSLQRAALFYKAMLDAADKLTRGQVRAGAK